MESNINLRVMKLRPLLLNRRPVVINLLSDFQVKTPNLILIKDEKKLRGRMICFHPVFAIIGADAQLLHIIPLSTLFVPSVL